ncbi:MAG TPA: nucleotidyltransferase domain-containing protein [Diaminobutyricibacter sp.]
MKHHEIAVERFVTRASADPDVLAVVVTGSVARGTERPDSDVDLYLVVSEERWDTAYEQRRLMYVEREGIGYEGGYYDVKLATLSYLDDAAERGDDPVRDSFAISRIAFSRVDDLPRRIERIGTVPDGLWDDRVASFVAQARLHGDYFLKGALGSGDVLLLRHASVHFAASAGRAVLAHNRVFFAGPKYLAKQVAALDNKPTGFDALLTAVVADPTVEAADALLAGLETFTGSVLPADETLSRFVLDNELAWRYRTKTPEYS